MQNKFKNLIAALLTFGITGVPLSIPFVRHHCSLTNSAYFAFAGNKITCHSDLSSTCSNNFSDSPDLHKERHEEGYCSPVEQKEQCNLSSFSATCCTNQMVPLYSNGIFNDYRTNLKFDTPESSIPEGFLLQPAYADIENYTVEIAAAPDYILPPNEIIILTGRLII